MTQQFIHPNWHVILVHYPLALLTTGLVIEILSFMWKRSTLRSAGRWMILLGMLAALPAVTTGIYAFLDAAKEASANPDGAWSELTQASRWQDGQWQFMRYHIWLTSAAAGLLLLAVIAWLGSSETWRRKLQWPVLAALVVALGGMVAGAWFSGEAVYRYGVAVQPQAVASVAQPAMENGAETILARIATYADPLQSHLLLVGLMLAFAAGALGLTLRRWNLQPQAEVPSAPETFATHEETLPMADEPLRFSETEPFQQTAALPTAATEVAPQPVAVYPARFWLLTSLLALLTAAAGLWHAEGDWRLPMTADLLKQATSATGWRELTAGQLQMLVHFILGIVIVLLPLILAAITRFSQGLKWITLVGVGLLLAAVGVQVWYGIVMLYSLQ